MPFHTITEFSFADFIAASLDYLLAHPLALSALVAAACYVVIRLCFAIAEESARRRNAKLTADRLASLTVAQDELSSNLIDIRNGRKRLDAVVSISSRRDGGRVA